MPGKLLCLTLDNRGIHQVKADLALLRGDGVAGPFQFANWYLIAHGFNYVRKHIEDKVAKVFQCRSVALGQLRDVLGHDLVTQQIDLWWDCPARD